MSSYRSPEPQQLSIDEVRPPIAWYQLEVETDEFDWKDVEKDVQEFDEGKVFPTNRKFNIHLL